MDKPFLGLFYIVLGHSDVTLVRLDVAELFLDVVTLLFAIAPLLPDPDFFLCQKAMLFCGSVLLCRLAGSGLSLLAAFCLICSFGATC